VEAIRLRRRRERARVSMSNRALMNYQRETRERLWVRVPVGEGV